MHVDSILKPPPLKQGDCIGLFFPSGPVREQEKFEAGLNLLHDLGYRTKQYSSVSNIDHEYLAAEDRSRAEEFHTMWEDEDVQAMMAVRGGYGCLRMMPYLNLDQLYHSPKTVVGFSDLTVLLNGLADRTGIVTIHGPVLTSLSSIDQDSLDSLLTILSGNGFASKKFRYPEILRGGTVDGILRGGNLTTISHLLGTPWEIPFRKTILFIEDTGEQMYKIDRMLTQLYISNRLEQLAGLMLGSFDLGMDDDVNSYLRESVWKRVLELTSNSDFPIWANVPIGHLNVNHALPIGMPATMDSSTGTIIMHDDL